MYNSASTIIETLDSIKNQTYSNLELIISDDFSSDNSIKICEEWIKVNADRFYNLRLITVTENTGIPANANRCIKASQANWVKFIAGDDTLKIDCIQQNMDFLLTYPEIEILQTTSDVYQGNFESANFESSIPSLKNQRFFNLDALAQNKIYWQSCLCTIYIFYKKCYSESGRF